MLVRIFDKWCEVVQKDLNLLINIDKTLRIYQDKTLLEFKEEYLSSSLQDVSTNITVGVVNKPASFYSESGTLALRNLNVIPMRLKLNDVKYFTKEGVTSNTKSILNEGDVVVTRSGTPGLATVIPKELEGSICIDMIVIRTDHSIDPEYLAMVINSSIGRVQSNSATAGTAQQHYNVGSIKKMNIPVPPINVQQEFVSKSNIFLTSRKMVEKRIEKTKSIMKPLADNFEVFN